MLNNMGEPLLRTAVEWLEVVGNTVTNCVAAAIKCDEVDVTDREVVCPIIEAEDMKILSTF